MGVLTVKLPQPLQAQLDEFVARRGQRKSDVVREAIERLVSSTDKAHSGSVLSLIQDLKGSGRGPKDLSSNPKHLQGYGK